MIDKCAKFEEVCERKSGRDNDRNRTGLWGGHPVRKYGRSRRAAAESKGGGCRHDHAHRPRQRSARPTDGMDG